MVLRINKLLFSAAVLGSVWSLSAQAADVETNTAHMQAMDKITGRVSEIDVPVNSLVRFGSFSILVRKCVTRTPEETPENTAFLDVVDDYDSKEPVNIFKGWVFSSSPGLNAIEHPIYDVWLLKCVDKDHKDVKRLSEEELRARDEIKMVRANKVEDNNSTQQDTENSDLAKVVEETIKEGAAPEVETEAEKVEPETVPEVVEVVVSTPENVSEDTEAPQALIQIQEQKQPTAEVGVASDDMAEDNMEDTAKAIEPEAPASAEEVVIEFEDENGFFEE